MTSFYALTHIKKKNIVNVLKSINSILKKDGLFLMTIGRGNFEAIAENFMGTNQPVFGTAYFKYELEEKVKKAGLNIIYSKIDTTKYGSYKEKTIYLIAKK